VGDEEGVGKRGGKRERERVHFKLATAVEIRDPAA
jgi:hypothetical protein